MKDIKNYEGLYAVTEDGQVYSYNSKKFLKSAPNKGGYCVVNLYKDKKIKNVYVHRLVAEAYLDNPNSLPEVNHIDENKSNNCISNLEWCDSTYNKSHGTRVQRIHEKNKELIRTGKYAPFGHKARKVYCVELDRTFDSRNQAEIITGIKGISQCCKGRQKTAGGYHWRYAS